MSPLSKAVRVLTLPVRVILSDPRVTGALLLAVLYYPEKLQSILPEKAFQVVNSPRFIQALKVCIGLGIVRAMNKRLSHYVVNNWMGNANFLQSQEIVLITGGCSGIGLGMAEEFSRMGTKVVVMDISPPKTSLRKLSYQIV